MTFNSLITSTSKLLQKHIKGLYKSPLITKLIVILILIYFIIRFSYQYIPYREGFTQKEKFLLKDKNNEIYDDFYASIYDDLVYDGVKNNFEINEISRITNMKPMTSYVLDIGCGTGHHLGLLQDRNIKCLGIEQSKAMINKAHKYYSNDKNDRNNTETIEINKNQKLYIKQDNIIDPMIFEANNFTHILCLYFTIYYIENKKELFANFYRWLKPGGYLCIHLVNRDKFNPIISAADPLMIVSPQKYAKERITNSIVKFKDFQYKANFKLNKRNNLGEFEETFKDDNTGNIRKNIHQFYMPQQREILAMAKDAGFTLLGKIDLVTVKYEYQYIYILQKSL
jgi:SAM-dependent methyltransferase